MKQIQSGIIVVLLYITLFTMLSCKSNPAVSSYYASGVECLGVERDGSQTLRAWGVGRDKRDAVEQAMKNAVHEVLFKGIRDGSSECNQRPLLLEVNAEERYEDYFNHFFRDGGAYKRFVNLKDEKKDSREFVTNKTQDKYAVTVRVLRAELKQHLIKEGILK